MNTRPPLVMSAILAGALLVVPAFAYQYPLSSSAIREAYLVGTADDNGSRAARAAYKHVLFDVTLDAYTSAVSISTPYSQVAAWASEMPNHDSQGAVKWFQGRPADFIVHADIYFLPDESDPDSLTRIQIFQHDKEIMPQSATREPLFPQHGGDFVDTAVIGQHVELDYDPAAFDSSPLTITIDVPGGQHAETSFDLGKLK